MALFSKIFQNRRNSRNTSTSPTDGIQKKQWDSLGFEDENIRLVIFRDHDLKGKSLLYDSKVPCSSIKQSQCCGKKRNVSCHDRGGGDKSDTSSGNTDNKSTSKPCKRNLSDIEMLGEMMFGSIQMAYRGSSLKVHSIRTPCQLMVTKVFIPCKPNKDNNGEPESFDSYSMQSTSSESNTTPKYISGSEKSNLSMAHSIPVDVPSSPKRASTDMVENEDSGISGSLASSASGMTTPYPSPDSSASHHSDSFNGMRRRWNRYQNKSLELHLSRRQSDTSETLPASKRPAKFGIGLIFCLPEDKAEASEHFQNFLFSHITLVESQVHKLKASVERALQTRVQNKFTACMHEALAVFRDWLRDLYTAPRLSKPVWLSMMTYNRQRVSLCASFLTDFMSAVEKFDTKANKFFLSSLITAVLTHHLAWVPTVTPAGATPARAYLDKHSAKWLDALARSHPYNPLWAQLGDMYGAIGFPLRQSRTVIVGKKADVINKLLYVLSYFIRCSEVLENKELLYTFDDDDPMTPIAMDTLSEHSACYSDGTLSASVQDTLISPPIMCDGFSGRSPADVYHCSHSRGDAGSPSSTQEEDVRRGAGPSTPLSPGCHTDPPSSDSTSSRCAMTCCCEDTSSSPSDTTSALSCEKCNRSIGTHASNLTSQTNILQAHHLSTVTSLTHHSSVANSQPNTSQSQAAYFSRVKLFEKLNRPGVRPLKFFRSLHEKSGVTDYCNQVEVMKQECNGGALHNSTDMSSDFESSIECPSDNSLAAGIVSSPEDVLTSDFCFTSASHLQRVVNCHSSQKLVEDGKSLLVSGLHVCSNDGVSRESWPQVNSDEQYCDTDHSSNVSPQHTTPFLQNSPVSAPSTVKVSGIHCSTSPCTKSASSTDFSSSPPMSAADIMGSSSPCRTKNSSSPSLSSSLCTSPVHHTSRVRKQNRGTVVFSDTKSVSTSPVHSTPVTGDEESSGSDELRKEQVSPHVVIEDPPRQADRYVGHAQIDRAPQQAFFDVNTDDTCVYSQTSSLISEAKMEDEVGLSILRKKQQRYTSAKDSAYISRCQSSTDDEMEEGDTFTCDSGVFGLNSSQFPSVDSGKTSSSISSTDMASLPPNFVCYSRSNSMFDEYFQEEVTDNTETNPLNYKRMASIEGSNSIFDEYMNSPCLVPERINGVDMCHQLGDSLDQSTDIERSTSSESEPGSKEGKNSEERTSQHSRPSHISGHILTKQSSNQSTGLPARCRSVTPTELSRRRHLSAASSIDFDPFSNMNEVPMPATEYETETEIAQVCPHSFGHSLLAGCSPRYLADFVLHGTTDANYLSKLHSHLNNSFQNSVLDEPITESTCVVADTDKWTVRLMSSHCCDSERVMVRDVAPAKLVTSVLESVHHLWKLQMSPEFCLMHLEDRLQEIYFKSKMLSEYLYQNKKTGATQLPPELNSILGIEDGDLALLQAVAGTHSAHLTFGL